VLFESDSSKKNSKRVLVTCSSCCDDF